MQGSHPLPQQSSKSGCGGGCGCGSGTVDGVMVGDIYSAGWAAVISLVEHLDLPTDHLDAGPAPVYWSDRRLFEGAPFLLLGVFPKGLPSAWLTLTASGNPLAR